MHVCVVIGARPQFIKAAELIRGGARQEVDFEVVHTGQHYDPGMSEVFFEELGIPEPDVNLNVGPATQSRQTGEIIRRFEEHLLERSLPDWVVLFGDTTSTLAGAIVASKMGIPIAHVEAGLRSFDRTMPEELNRLICDRLSTALFCPSETSVSNLAAEGMTDGVYLTGDIMYDSVVRHRGVIDERAKRVAIDRGAEPWAVVTVHRAANVDDESRLKKILECLEAAGMPVVWPVHPRARARLDSAGLDLPKNVRPIAPFGYLDMLAHISASSAVLTDSGGIQKEAFWLRTPCVTLRDTTEWPETVELGWNVLVSVEATSVREALTGVPPADVANPYGAGDAAQRMMSHLILYPDSR